MEGLCVCFPGCRLDVICHSMDWLCSKSNLYVELRERGKQAKEAEALVEFVNVAWIFGGCCQQSHVHINGMS